MNSPSAQSLAPGQRLRSTEEIEVTEQEIIEFARRWDPQPAHLGEDTATATPFLGLAASGWHTAAMTMRLFVGLGLGGLIGASVEVRWPTPTRPGDRLHLEARVVDARQSRSNPERTVVTMEYDTVNQNGEVRQHTRAVVIAA